MLDFSAIMPEINSARMYSGPGSGSMLAAAAAWNTAAAEMRTAAAGYESVIAELTSGGWFGPSSTSMLAAAAPYLAWLNTTATQAEQAGAQANAAATAFESAFAMTVPPAVVAANRTQLANLVATNVFGQNTPAIAANEAQYAEMWAQDATAMNSYAVASSAATQMTPFTSPQSSTTPDAVAGQTEAVNQATKTPAGVTQSTLSQASSNVLGTSNTVLGDPADPAAFPDTGLYGFLVNNVLTTNNNSAVGQFLASNFFSSTVVNGALAGGPFNPQFILASVAGFSYMWPSAGTTLSGLGDVASLGAGAGLMSDTVGSTGMAAVSGGVGHANLVGSLSVPQSWASAANITPADVATPATGLSDIGSSPAAGGPGGFAGPMGGTARRLRRAIPKYGFKPVVMPRPPAAG